MPDKNIINAPNVAIDPCKLLFTLKKWAIKNNPQTVTPWLNIWKIAPEIPELFIEKIPIIITLIWIIDVYATIRLKSFCIQANTDPYIIPHVAHI